MQNQSSQYDNGSQRPVVVKSRVNGMGIAGFVLSIMAPLLLLFLTAIGAKGSFEAMMALCIIVLILGLVFSFIGLFKRPRGFAIAGLCISLLIAIIGAATS